jgi:2-polyprenyl-6-methoxyphenol hydroxylase-like FAD-dependent oxidoreductase
MTMADYDLITVGGGLVGAALGRALAQAGKRVLIVEGEREFRDRVRGEQMATWGVADAKALGILDILRASCAHEPAWWDAFIGPMQIQHRELAATTPQQLNNLTFYHPKMQETLLAAASAAGAEVMRGARVNAVLSGETPTVTIVNGSEERLTARLVAGCDGRNSSVRGWGGFVPEQDPDRCQIAGLLLEDVPADDNVMTFATDPGAGTGAILFPQGHGRVRSYMASRVTDGHRLSGEKEIPRYMELLRNKLPNGEAMLKGARPAGPLATFNGADNFVRSPYRNGIALVGDAAAMSDPTWGQGLSLGVRDARVLRDQLLETDDWDAAGRAYAAKHDEHYGAVRACEDWFTEIFYGFGPEADARRGRAFPLIAQEPDRVPDILQSGPESAPITDETRRRFYGEE